MVASASFTKSLNQLTLTLTNVQSAESFCEPAELSAASNIANLFTLELRVNALSPSGDIFSGTYTNATATLSVADSTCTNTIGEVAGDAIVEIDVSLEAITGAVRAQFPGSIFIVTYDAPECSATSSADGGPDCQVLPPCPDAGAFGGSPCIDGP